MEDGVVVKVEQSDRDAAASGYFAWVSGNPVIPKKMKDGLIDDPSMIQAFARRRLAGMEMAAKIVEAQADIIGAMPGSSIHSALKHAADEIRKHAGTHDQG